MKDGWKRLKLGEICTTNALSYSSRDKWLFVNYLDTGNITENRIDNIQRLNIGHDTIPSRAKRKVNPGDIIYSTVRPNQRHYGFIETSLPNMLVSTGFTTISVNPNLADTKYVYYLLTQEDIILRLQAIAEQSVSAYPSLKAKIMQQEDDLRGLAKLRNKNVQTNMSKSLFVAAGWFFVIARPRRRRSNPVIQRAGLTALRLFSSSRLGREQASDVALGASSSSLSRARASTALPSFERRFVPRL